MTYHHRQAFFTSLVRFFGIPILLTYLVLRLSQCQSTSWPQSLLFGILYILSVPLFWSVRNIIRLRLQDREARRLGARPIPRIKGKWPGNIDVLVDMFKTMQKGYIGEWVHKMSLIYGPTFNTRVMWEDVIFTIDHDVIKFSLATGFEHFEKGPTQRNRSETMMGDGIFNRDGDVWRFHRTMARPFFARERISDFHLYDRYTQKVLSIFHNHEGRDVACDAQDVFSRFTMDAAGDFLFGASDLNTLDLPLPVAGQAKMGPKGTLAEGGYGNFVSAFEKALILLPIRSRLGKHLWPAAELFADKARPYRNEIDFWIQPLLDQAFGRRDSWLRGGGDAKQPAGETFIDHLVSSTDDRKMIANELINLLLAARDTTASLLTFSVYLLAMHPEVMERARAEVLDTVGESAAPNYDQIKQMRYQRAIINEVLRLFPSVPLNERASSHSVVLPAKPTETPLYMPGTHTSMIYSTMLMQRDPELWGPDADLFDPMRWLDHRHKRVLSDPFKFIPFNAGPRICLGQQFALNEASFVLTRLLQNFSAFELAMDAAPEGSCPPAEWAQGTGRKPLEKIWPKSAVTLYSHGGMWIKFKSALKQ
ncbi:Cytochrome P450 52E2 OS=Candida apicola GN=CYP52E2 PE=3 SV=1 [Rhizoctonia solani AG-1 IB]|uniref:Cytochrome P450 52E2 n=2 Tax=Thanatephorus cucumeris (strain AG1-IB / isolate 7/3/14) TaxID=1108050 RepID=A0A0B7FXX3_THACB|nr:Cytochrome P450 52E2 OS=Candida apicola GN=CYP52E2 PE=3 SV=1 [Rhizoctonia solani AG-1 IB]